MTININNIADFIIIKLHEPLYSTNTFLTVNKLQTLLYYCQAWYLALYNKTLFEDKFEAGIFCPVNIKLRNRLNINRFGSITLDHLSNSNIIELSETNSNHIIQILNIYSKYGDFELSEMVRKELPWIHARKNTDSAKHSCTEINEDLMKDYYRLLMKYKDL